MMKKIFFIMILFSLLLAPLSKLSAQSSITTEKTMTFEKSTLPQWAKDMRRFDIIAFGTFPFSMFFVTFAYDMYRWNAANGMDFSEQGRQYAPWPLRTAGGVEMTGEDYQKVILMAVGLSLTLALTDLVITLVKRDKERRRTEKIQSGTYEIERKPYGEPEEDEPVPDTSE